MKIRAELPDGAFLVQLSEKEMANVLGVYSFYNNREAKETLKKGIIKDIDIPITDLYKKSYELDVFVKNNEIDSVRKKLQSMLDNITPVQDKIKIINDEFNKIIISEIKG